MRMIIPCYDNDKFLVDENNDLTGQSDENDVFLIMKGRISY